MRLRPKGKRICFEDCHLVLRMRLLFLVGSWLVFMTLCQLPFLAFFFRQADLLQHVQSPYFLFSAVLSCVLSAGLLFFVRWRCYLFVAKLRHRERLAKMIVENGWYTKESSEKVGAWGFSLGERVTFFPKMYYFMRSGYVHLYVEVTMGKFQDVLLSLEKKLEVGLFSELVDKVIHEDYVEYILLYDMIAHRISLSEVVAADGRVRLMEAQYWAYDSLPHMLIAGGTGGGKTYFILSLIEALVPISPYITILDPKNADLADLSTVLPFVYSEADSIMEAVIRFYDGMMARNVKMKELPNYKTGENYAYLGLEPHFLIFDEYVAFMDMLSNKEAMEIMSYLKRIVMLGRQSGYFLILACQRPDAKYLADGIRDQFHFRVALGKMSSLGYSMMFGETDKLFFQKPIKGRGYCDAGNSVIQEFYAPLVPKNHDFLRTIKIRSSSSSMDRVGKS